MRQITPIAPLLLDRLALAAVLATALALTGCATLGNPPASDAGAGEGLLATSQANLTSLGEVIAKHPDDPQAYNMRGTVYGEAGRNDQALADFNKAIGLDPQLRAGLCQSRADLSQDQQARSRACR